MYVSHALTNFFTLLTSEEMGWHYLQEIQRYSLCLTLEDRKVNAVDFTSAFSLSTRRRVLSSRRLRYFPVVTWRSRKGWPHLMWLPLHLTETGQIDLTAAAPQGRQQWTARASMSTGLCLCHPGSCSQAPQDAGGTDVSSQNKTGIWDSQVTFSICN